MNQPISCSSSAAQPDRSRLPLPAAAAGFTLSAVRREGSRESTIPLRARRPGAVLQTGQRREPESPGGQSGAGRSPGDTVKHRIRHPTIRPSGTPRATLKATSSENPCTDGSRSWLPRYPPRPASSLSRRRHGGLRPSSGW
jgi:hypothetical protein